MGMATGIPPRAVTIFVAKTGATDLHPFEILKSVDGGFAVEKAGAVGMQKHHLHPVEFLRFEFLVKVVDQPGRRHAALDPNRQVDHLRQRELSPGIGENRHSQIGDALLHAVDNTCRPASGCRPEKHPP